tara:strand:+ start:1651 stop:1788 length:138 start_codon:yes stop_codon:yes gene_type:complete
MKKKIIILSIIGLMVIGLGVGLYFTFANMGSTSSPPPMINNELSK